MTRDRDLSKIATYAYIGACATLGDSETGSVFAHWTHVLTALGIFVVDGRGWPESVRLGGLHAGTTLQRVWNTGARVAPWYAVPADLAVSDFFPPHDDEDA